MVLVATPGASWIDPGGQGVKRCRNIEALPETQRRRGSLLWQGEFTYVKAKSRPNRRASIIRQKARFEGRTTAVVDLVLAQGGTVVTGYEDEGYCGT
jgi:hypothetical protein